MVRISISIPDSCLSDSVSLFAKSHKISQIARACSIFRVNTIFIYHDRTINCNDNLILKTIFEYLDTPPYLRKKLYPEMRLLKYAGSLPPIKSPHHKSKIDLDNMRTEEYRVGLVVRSNGKMYVDVGLERPLPFEGEIKEKTKVIVRIRRNRNEFRCKNVQKNEVNGYWGYNVQFVLSLYGLMSNDKFKVLITSKEGKFFRIKDLSDRRNREILILFGSPRIGVNKILESENDGVRHYFKDFTFNMFPDQGTDTVRLEEAVLGTLSIVNHTLSINGT